MIVYRGQGDEPIMPRSIDEETSAKRHTGARGVGWGDTCDPSRATSTAQQMNYTSMYLIIKPCVLDEKAHELAPRANNCIHVPAHLCLVGRHSEDIDQGMYHNHYQLIQCRGT